MRRDVRQGSRYRKCGPGGAEDPESLDCCSTRLETTCMRRSGPEILPGQRNSSHLKDNDRTKVERLESPSRCESPSPPSGRGLRDRSSSFRRQLSTLKGLYAQYNWHELRGITNGHYYIQKLQGDHWLRLQTDRLKISIDALV